MNLLVRVGWKGTTLEEGVGCLGDQHLVTENQKAIHTPCYNTNKHTNYSLTVQFKC